MAQLRNKLNKTQALARLAEETIPRQTISFYKYTEIEDPKALREELFRAWSAMGVLGRIYVAKEGINAQLSIPEDRVDMLRTHVNAFPFFKGVPFKMALEEGEPSFWKLTIKVKRQIVADGLPEGAYDMKKIGAHLNAKEFNEALENGATVVDMRNGYESRVGRFEGAVTLPVRTFREQLPKTAEALKGKEEEEVLLYCTGGIRCEKTSAYLKKQGFKKVYQLHGGIIDYTHQVKRENLDCKFKGKNYVFDGRSCETVTDDVLTHCDQCEAVCDTYVNCKNSACNHHFIQCEACSVKMQGSCSKECAEIAVLPEEKQRALRRGKKPSLETLYQA